MSSPEKEKIDTIFQRLSRQKIWFNFLAMLPVGCIMSGKSPHLVLLQLLLYTIEISPISLAQCDDNCIKMYQNVPERKDISIAQMYLDMYKGHL